MAIIPCPNCGNSVSSEASMCPSCNQRIMVNKPQAAPTATQVSNPFDSLGNQFMTNKIPTIGDWMVTFLLMSIPLVGFIMLIVWASDGNNRIRKNFAAAALIWMLIVTVLFVLLWGVIIASIMGSMGRY